MKKSLWIAVFLIDLVASLPASSAAERIRVKLDGPIRGEHAMFFVAQEKGYLKEENVEMTIEEGGGALNTLLLVSQLKYEIGFADLPALVVARSSGFGVQALAVVGQKSPMALVALKGTGLRTPADVEGKVVVADSGDGTFLFYGTLLAVNRVSRTKVTEVVPTPPYAPLLLAKKVQVIPTDMGNQLPELEAAAGGADGLEMLRGIDWGYDVFGSGLFANVRLLAARPALARRFVRAYLRAFRDVIAEPREAVAILVKSHPKEAGRSDVLLRQLEANIRSTFTSEDTKVHGLGWSSPDRWQRTYDLLMRSRMLPKPIERLDSLYTNEFVGR